jgi:hypothetical protein
LSPVKLYGMRDEKEVSPEDVLFPELEPLAPSSAGFSATSGTSSLPRSSCPYV